MRLEYKYLIPNELLNDLKNDFKPFVVLDKYAEMRNEKEYIVRSIYFDTLNFDYYHEKIEGIRTRKKLRIRGYNSLEECDTVFLEIKRKYGSRILKNRAPLHFNDLETLLESGDTEKYILNNNGRSDRVDDAKKFLFHFYGKVLVPINLIVYDREAYFSKFDESLRITIDKNLRAKSFLSYKNIFDNNSLLHSMPNHQILEVKFHSGMPAWLKNIIGKFELSRLPVSKYTISLDFENHLGKPQRKNALAFVN